MQVMCGYKFLHLLAVALHCSGSVERGATAIECKCFLESTSNDIFGKVELFGNTGGNIPFATSKNPYLAVNFIICLFGSFSSRS